MNLAAQNGFQYQAVARNDKGEPLVHKPVSLRFTIIQNDIDGAGIYQETHRLLTNEYGLITTRVGLGLPVYGDFATINWQFNSFLEIEMDIDGGEQYEWMGRSELMPVPKALYAERAGSIAGRRDGLYVTDFGAVGDGVTDDTPAFLAVLDSALINGSTVIVPSGVYKVMEPLVLGDGVSIVGEGMGSDPLQTPYNGSMIQYFGSGYALVLEGHNSGVKKVVIHDRTEGKAKGGVLIHANGRLVENVHMEQVLISGFTGGTGIKLKADNQGGIAYACIHNLRVRNALRGIHLQAESSSFINSNSFFGGVVSGGGFDHCLLVDGGYTNIFYGTAFEPYLSRKGHLVINKGSIIGQDIRVEGLYQPKHIPLIYFAAGTRNTTIRGVQDGGWVTDLGNNTVKMPNGKKISPAQSNHNRLSNAAFNGFKNGILPHWTIGGELTKVSIENPEVMANHKVLKLVVAPGQSCWLKPSNVEWPGSSPLGIYDQMHFGFYVKTNVPGVVYTRTNAPQGLTISSKHRGGNNWEFIGMNAMVDRTAPLDARLAVENNSSRWVEVFISTPTLAFGQPAPLLEEKAITTGGGEIIGDLEIIGSLQVSGELTGLLSRNIVEVEKIPANGRMILPRIGNLFRIMNAGPDVHRINDTTFERFPEGAIITLLFEHQGQTLIQNPYLMLNGIFKSMNKYSSITLLSMGDGTWREVNRNQ